jgi:hypothetical protein
MMEPVYFASSSQAMPKDRRRYAPKLSAPSPLVAKSDEVTLDLCFEEETLAHNVLFGMLPLH